MSIADIAERFRKWNVRLLDLFEKGYGNGYTDQVADDVIEALDEYARAAHDNGKREAFEKVLKLARGTKEDGRALAKKAHAEGDPAMEMRWSGEAEGAAEIERDIMNLLGIDWANGETEVCS